MKRLVTICLFLILILSLRAPPAFADRDTNDDLMLWTELGLSYSIKETPWSVYWAMENRFDDDISQHHVFNTTLGFYYKVFDWFKTGGAVRYEKEDEKDHEIRPMIHAIFSHKFGNKTPFKVEARNRFEFRNFIDKEKDSFRFRYRLRFKAGPTFKTKIASVNPWFSNEFFFQEKDDNFAFDQDRIATGVTLGFKTGGVKIKYTPLYYLFRLDRKRIDDAPDKWIGRHVLGTSVGLSF